MKRRKKLMLTGLISGSIAVAGFFFVYLGLYNVSALAQHTRPVFYLLQYAMVRAAETRSESVEVPDLRQLDWRQSGLALYTQHCQQCHGAPGVAPESFSLGMTPSPTAIAAIARHREAGHIFWVTKHGIKMTGMPAWQFRLNERQLWEVVAFVKQIPYLTVAEYLELRNRLQETQRPQVQVTGPARRGPDAEKQAGPVLSEPFDPVERGRIALQQYNCSSCHEIPGITAANNHVGPPLGGITGRSFIAGLLENTDENLIRWIRFPHEIDPKSAMPDLGVTEEHARYMIAYFQSLED